MLERLIDFAEQGNQHKILCTTPSGKPTEYQGWIMEINDQALLISTGEGDKAGKDIWLSFSQLEHATFFFWNHRTSQWQEFIL